jgi:bifunctional non-homologous end joining protein LigD
MPASLLSSIEPISFVSRSTPFDSPEWLFEPLYAGGRALLHLAEGACRIETADNQTMFGQEELEERLAGVAPGNVEAVLDGLVVALDRHGAPLRAGHEREGFLAFAAFDLPWLDADLRGLPLARRREMLATLLSRDTGTLFKIFSLEEHGRALFAAARRMDLGGIMARRLSDPYGPESVWYTIPVPSSGQTGLTPAPFARREPARRHRRALAE